MAKMIKAGKTNINVREKALQLTAGLPSKNWLSETKAIFYFVRDEIRYVKDVDGVETLTEPQQTLIYGAGDCDDKVILAGSLLQSIGHPVRLIAVGFNNRGFSHVFLETLIGTKWIPMELTANLDFGTPPSGITLHMIEHLNLSR